MGWRVARILGSSLLALLAFPAESAYKCDEGGRIVYSDVPCGRVVGQIKPSPAPTPLDQARALLESKTLIAVHQHKVFIGMPEKKALESWGPPTTVNRTVTGSGVREQWVYRHQNGATQYIYLENGVVTAISEN